MAKANFADLAANTTPPLGLKRIPPFTGKETLKEAALMWAREGAAVIPLARMSKNPGSILGKGWPHQATNELDVVERWFSRADVGGVAVSTGKSGVVVIDVDQNIVGIDGGIVEHTRGLDSLRAHRYFLMPDDKKIGCSSEGLEGFKGDVRGHGGCVAVYPTPHPEGGQYIFREGAAGAEIPPLPAELKGKLKEPGMSAADPMSLADALAALDNDGPAVPNDYLRDQYITRFDNRVNSGTARHEAAWITMANLFRDLFKGKAGRAEYDAVYDHMLFQMTMRISEHRNPRSDEVARADLDRCTADAYSQALAQWHEALEKDDAAAEISDPMSDGPWIILTEDEMASIEFPAALIEDCLVPVGVGQIYGDSMAGKTFVAVDLAFRVAEGRDWFGYKVNTPGDVVYVYKEGAKSMQERRKGWRIAHGHVETPAGRVLFVHSPTGMFSDEADVLKLERSLTRRGIHPRLIIGDTQALLLDTSDENDNAEAGKHTRILKAWSERMGCLILLLHHTTKDGAVSNGSRGAGAWKGNSDVLITVEHPLDPNEAKTPHLLRVAKYKDGAPWEGRTTFSIRQVGDTKGEAVLVAGPPADPAANLKSQEAHDIPVLQAVRSLGPEANVSGVAREVNKTRPAASRKLGNLAKRGLIVRLSDKSPYELTPAGVDALSGA